jgi:type I restriction enzyme S subunit
VTAWVSKRLSEVTSKIGSGATPLGGEAAYKQHGIALIRSLNVHDGEFRLKDLAFLDQVQASRLDNVIVESGDILLNITGASVARCCLVPEEVLPARVNQHVAIVRPLQNLLLPKFLQYMLVSRDCKDRLLHTGESAGSTRQALTKAQLQDFVVRFPESINEQHRIVTLLDEAFADIATAKANAEKNLQNARELFDNALQSLVDGTSNDWTERTMAEVCDITSKLVDPREDQYLDLPHVGAGNIESKTSALVDVKTAREENLISGKFLFDESMVLYSKIRPYLMKVVRPDFNGLCSADIYPLAPKPDIITRDYLYFLLLAPTFTEYAIKGSARAGMPKVNREHLFAYQFVLPKVQDQKRISENLDQIAKETILLESIYRKKLTALDDLKKSLLHQAFSGQLTQ